MPLAAFQRSKPTTKTRAQPKPGHAAIAHSRNPATTLHPIVQAKLRIGAPDHHYEREADRVADQVMLEQGPAPEPTLESPETVQRKCATCSSGGSGLCPECEEELQRHALPVTPLVQRKTVDSGSGMNIQRACACGGTCASCAGKETERGEIETKLIVGRSDDVYEREADQAIRRPAPPTTAGTAVSGPAQVPDLQAYIQSLTGDGQPLPATTRAFFEPRFGSNFSQVRVHTDARAAAAVRAVNALAFTVGPDLVFGAGQYAPGTTEGRRLLAHELMHVLQQAGGTPLGIQRFTDEDLGFKHEAQQTDSAEAEPSVILDPQFWSDLIASIEESFYYAPEILGEVGQAILDHYILFTGAMILFLGAEAAVGALAATPDPSMITKIVSAALQWLIFLFLAFFAAVEVYEAVDSATSWWTLVAQAKGDPAVIAEAAKEFCWMTFHIVMAILVAIGARVRLPGVPGRAAGSAVESSTIEAVEGSGAGGSSNVVELGTVRAAQTASSSGGVSSAPVARGGPIVEGSSALKFEPAFEPMTEVPLIDPPIEVGPLIETSPSVLANALKLAQRPVVTGAAVITSAAVLAESVAEPELEPTAGSKRKHREGAQPLPPLIPEVDYDEPSPGKARDPCLMYRVPRCSDLITFSEVDVNTLLSAAQAQEPLATRYPSTQWTWVGRSETFRSPPCGQGFSDRPGTHHTFHPRNRNTRAIDTRAQITIVCCPCCRPAEGPLGVTFPIFCSIDNIIAPGP